MQNWFKKIVYTTCNFVQKAKKISFGLVAAFVLSATLNEADAQFVETYTKNGKFEVVLTKENPSHQWDLHAWAAGYQTWWSLHKINTKTGGFEKVDEAYDNEYVQKWAVQLRYLGTGVNEFPAIAIPLDSLETLEQGILYNLHVVTYYNWELMSILIAFSKGSDNTISIHGIPKSNGSQAPIPWTYQNERWTNKPIREEWSHDITNTNIINGVFGVKKWQAQSIDGGLIPTAFKGDIALVAKDGTIITIKKENFILNTTNSTYEQKITFSPNYNNGIKSYQDNNGKLDFTSTLFGNNGDGMAHFPWFAKEIANPANPYATPKFGAPSITSVDAYRSTATVPVTGIDRSPASGVAVRSTNSSGQSTPGSFNTSNNQATFANLGVTPDKLSEKYTLEVQWGKADYSKTEKSTVIIDNKAAPIWSPIPDVSLSQGESKTINLNDYANFKGNTLFEADGQLPAGVTLQNGVVTISAAANPQDKTIIKLKAYRNLSQGGKSAEATTTFKLTVSEKISTQSGVAVSPQILSISTEITVESSWNSYNSYHLYKASGNGLNDAPVKTGKIALPGKIDLSGLEAGTYSLYLFHSKTGGGKVVIVIKK